MEIIFTDEAGDTQVSVLGLLKGYRVSVTTEQDETFDANLVAPATEAETFNDVIVRPWDETSDSLMDEVVVRAKTIIVL